MKAELLILGVLHREDMHPYEIKRRLEAAMIDRWIDIDTGTLYYAVRQLAKDGHIRPVSEERVARGGARTIYTLTDSGRARFQSLLVQRFADNDPILHPLFPALPFLHHVDIAAVIPLVEKRIAGCREAQAMLSGMLARLDPVLGTGNRLLMEHSRDLSALEVAWLERMLLALKAGPQDAKLSRLPADGPYSPLPVGNET